MKRDLLPKLLLATVTLLLTACVTVNIYFPAAEVQKAAEEIAKQVRGTAPPAEEQQPARDNQSKMDIFRNISPVATALAADELTVSNATIRQLKARMKQRYQKLAPFFRKGILGEKADGFLVIRNSNGLDLRTKTQVKRLVQAENSDRKALYAAVAQAMKIPASQITRIAAIFAKQWQNTAPKGTWLETQPGKWVKK